MNCLKDLRENKNLTQEKIAKEISCSQTTYSRYESSELNIPIETLKKLAIYYNTSVDYIIGLTDVKHPYKRSTKHKFKIK